jgi:hypothetical protein
MAMDFLCNVDFNKNQLQNPVIHPLGTAPSSPSEGQIYFDSTTGDKKLYLYNGSAWVALATGSDSYVSDVALSGSNLTFTAVGSAFSGTIDLSGIDTGINSIELASDGNATSGNTITTDGTLTLSFDGSSSQYVNGAGNLTTFPSIPTVNDGTLTVQGTGALGGTGTFTANQSGNTTISVTHDTFGTAGTYAYPSSVTTNDTGHITAITAGSAPATPSDATITLAAGDILNGGGAFTLNQSSNETITFNLDTGGAGAATYGSTSDSIKIDTITLDAYGRVTAVATGATGQVNSVSSGSSTTITTGGNAINPTVSAVTAAVANGGTALATGDQIYDFVTGQIANIPSGLSFEGNWNANTDSPDLSGLSPNNGQFWIVSVAGNTNLDGITDWKVGDWAIYVSTGAGTDGWQKVDNSSTLSGFGDTNQVTYWTSTGNVAGDTGFTFNPTSNNLTVGGSVTWSGGSSAESNSAYDNMITALSVAGTTTKTLTATQQDGGTLTASWTDNNTEYSMMTASTLGLGKLEDNTTQTVAANSVSATASRTYGVQKNSSNQLVVNVPWTDSNSGGTVTGVTGTTPINSSGGTTPNITIDPGTASVAGAARVTAGTGISVAVSSGNFTVTNTDTNSSNSFAATISSGTTTAEITHGLNSADVIIQLYDMTTEATVYACVARTDSSGNASTTKAKITFGSATTNDVRVLVYKVG